MRGCFPAVSQFNIALISYQKITILGNENDSAGRPAFLLNREPAISD